MFFFFLIGENKLLCADERPVQIQFRLSVWNSSV